MPPRLSTRSWGIDRTALGALRLLDVLIHLIMDPPQTGGSTVTPRN
jgi:hypothetical protein